MSFLTRCVCVCVCVFISLLASCQCFFYSARVSAAASSFSIERLSTVRPSTRDSHGSVAEEYFPPKHLIKFKTLRVSYEQPHFKDAKGVTALLLTLPVSAHDVYAPSAKAPHYLTKL